MRAHRNERAIPRRHFLAWGGAAGALAGLERLVPDYLHRGGDRSHPGRPPDVLHGGDGPIHLTIARTPVEVDGRRAMATTINGTVPGPLLRFREGDEAVIHVTNELDEDTSIHWHGILLPNGMDGVPNVNFPGIRPGETFTYRYPIRQYGTYWYHSHSGLQEQEGHYAPLVIDPAGDDPVAFDRSSSRTGRSRMPTGSWPGSRRSRTTTTSGSAPSSTSSGTRPGTASARRSGTGSHGARCA